MECDASSTSLKLDSLLAALIPADGAGLPAKDAGAEVDISRRDSIITRAGEAGRLGEAGNDCVRGLDGERGGVASGSDSGFR